MNYNTKKVVYEPSLKAQQVWKEAPYATHRILEGAVRSSKSYTADDIAIHEISALPSCNILISGYSITSVSRNIIAAWKEMIDPLNFGIFRTKREDKDDYLTIDWRGLRGKKFYIRGAGKEHDFKHIQGATFGYWYSDELTRHAESFTMMAYSRLSLPYAKSLGTTNPDSPFHYVKKNFLDNPDLYKKSENGLFAFASWKFVLDDNPSLIDSYKSTLKKTYTGLFYKRFIDGLWVQAEGSIYDFFDEKHHTYTMHNKVHSSVVGIDYGTGNPTCFIEFYKNPFSKPFIWAEREYYYDSKEHGIQKTDGEYADDFVEWIGDSNPTWIIIDPSALSFKLELMKRGFTQIKEANNEVLNGIRTQAKMLKSGEYGVGTNCKQTIQDYGAYVWDERAQKKGEDKPLKEHDHTKDVERYVLHTLYGEGTIDYEEFTKD